VLFIAVVVVFFVLAAFLVVACERLLGPNAEAGEVREP
jgi:hypothetical protein